MKFLNPFFLKFSYKYVFIYIKVSKFLSAKKTAKKVFERHQNLSKEEKEKSNNMVVNVTKISQRVKNKSLLSIEKNIIEWEKMGKCNYNYNICFKK